MSDVEEADKVMMGAEKIVVMSEDEKKSAYHEGGHA